MKLMNRKIRDFEGYIGLIEKFRWNQNACNLTFDYHPFFKMLMPESNWLNVFSKLDLKLKKEFFVSSHDTYNFLVEELHSLDITIGHAHVAYYYPQNYHDVYQI